MAYQNFKVIQNTEKQMPCNIEAEQAVIGSILVSNDIYDEISPIIDSNKYNINIIHFIFIAILPTLILTYFGVLNN